MPTNGVIDFLTSQCPCFVTIVVLLSDKLTELAKQSYCAVKKTSPMIEEVKYYVQELLRLTKRKQGILDEMVSLAQPLPEYEILLTQPYVVFFRHTKGKRVMGCYFGIIG